MTKKIDAETRRLLAAGLSRLVDRNAKEQSERALIDFTDYCWPIVDPATPLVHGYTMDAIAAHLEAVAYGHIKRLLVTVFPGSSKSTLLSVMFPAWVWGPLNMPHMRFINASYGEHLTIRDNLRCRRVVTHDSYTALWGDRFHLEEPIQAYKFATNHQGWKLATSVGGIGLGERCDCWLIDDPNSPKVESEIVRRSTNMWFTEVVPDRLNSMTESRIIVIQQRMHLEDVAGTALAKDLGYVHLNIPMEYEPRLYVNAYKPDSDEIETFFDEDAKACLEEDVFWRDWRSSDGELAWPERWPQKVVNELKSVHGPTAYSAKYQQRPVPRGGAIIKSEYWQLWKETHFPGFEYLIASCDTAYTEDEKNDPSAMTVWGLTHDTYGNPRIMLVWAWTEHLEFHALVEKIIHTCTVGEPKGARFPVHKLLIENKASGLSVTQEIDRQVRGAGQFTVDAVDTKKWGDKIGRLNSIQFMFASKMIWAPDRTYAQAVIDQLADFPYAGHDDYVDCASMVLHWLRDCGYTPTAREAQDDYDLLYAYPNKSSNKPLYFPY